MGAFVGYLVPPILLFVPLAPLVAKLGLMDSRWALVLVYPTITVLGRFVQGLTGAGES